MNLQTIVVGAIVLFAFLYVGKSVWKKVKSFSTKSSCGDDCGCAAKPKVKNLARVGER